MLILAGGFVLWLFGVWEHHVDKRGGEPLVRLAMLGNRQFTGGLVMFFFQFLRFRRSSIDQCRRVQ